MARIRWFVRPMRTRTVKLLSAFLLWATPGAAQVGMMAVPRIRPLNSRAAVAILAHELQHARKIARASHVKTQRDFNAFYRHIDIGGAVAHAFETAEAQLMGQRVRREINAGPGAMNDPRR